MFIDSVSDLVKNTKQKAKSNWYWYMCLVYAMWMFSNGHMQGQKAFSVIIEVVFWWVFVLKGI